MFTYGQICLQGTGDVALVYPYHEHFPDNAVLNEPYCFSDSLRLWVLAFDVDTDNLLLPPTCPLGEMY